MATLHEQKAGDPIFDEDRAAKGAVLRTVIERRTAAQVAMDDAATDLMLTAEALVEMWAKTPSLLTPPMQALGVKVDLWRRAVHDYREAMGGRTDNGNLRA
jgi:hypothetical protein